MNIKDILNSKKNSDYQTFQEKICHTNYPILGVNIPTLRKVARDLLKENDYEKVLKMLDDSCFEMVMLHGIVIGNVAVDFKKRLELIDNFLPLIDSWALCDNLVTNLKFVKQNKKEFFIYLHSILNSEQEYYLRFAIVSLLTYYNNDDYYQDVLNILINIKSDYFYVKMALAWAYAMLMTKYFTKTINFMQDNKKMIDKWVYNKALQKGCESLQLDVKQKAILRSLKT